MIQQKDLAEIKSRNFFENVNHYQEFDFVVSDLILGKGNNKSAFITILIPVYNHPIKLTKNAIDSALNQKGNIDYKILIVDNMARTDPTDTELYLRKIKSDKIIYYKNRKNIGVFGNWNRAIMLAQSDWVTFLHSDDMLKNNFLENMVEIIKKHPQIDQLACQYKKINIKEKEDLNFEEECQGHSGIKTVRRIKEFDYFDGMLTSIKGAVYRRKKLIEIGGFRSQDDGLGLGDYTAMMRFSYYFKTYLLDDILYLNTWGYNDSLNLKLWFPELIANYYMDLFLAEKANIIWRKLYKNMAQILLLSRAVAYQNGKNWIGVPIEIDMNELKHACQLKSLDIGNTKRVLSIFLFKLLKKCQLFSREKFKVSIHAYD